MVAYWLLSVLGIKESMSFQFLNPWIQVYWYIISLKTEYIFSSQFSSVKSGISCSDPWWGVSPLSPCFSHPYANLADYYKELTFSCSNRGTCVKNVRVYWKTLIEFWKVAEARVQLEIIKSSFIVCFSRLIICSLSLLDSLAKHDRIYSNFPHFVCALYLTKTEKNAILW